MSIDQSSFNKHSLLDSAETMRVDAPTQGVQATGHIDGNGLLAALLQRAQPTFADVLANTDIRDLLKNADNNASNGREQIVKSNSETLKATIEAAAQVATAALGAKKAPSGGGSSDSNSGGTSGSSSGSGSASGSGGASGSSSDSEESDSDSSGSFSTGSNSGGGSDPSGSASSGDPKPQPTNPKPTEPNPGSSDDPQPQPSEPKPTEPTPGSSDDLVPEEDSTSADPLPGETVEPNNLVVDLFGAIKNNVDPEKWVVSGFEPLEGDEIRLSKADIARIARVTCLENGTTPEELYQAVMNTFAPKQEGES